MSMRTILVSVAILVAACRPSTTTTTATASTSSSSRPSAVVGGELALPTVACDRDGQLGPQHADVAPTMKVRVTPALARIEAPSSSLRVYTDGTSAVLAPIGWKCKGWYGSNGAGLTVGPTQAALESGWTGEKVGVDAFMWTTSGRLTAGPIAARLLPSFRAKAQAVADETKAPNEAHAPLETRPYPGERVTPLADGSARFDDPPNVRGTAGTSALATAGTVRSNDDSLSMIVVRLAAPRDALVEVIRSGFEAASATTNE